LSLLHQRLGRSTALDLFLLGGATKFHWPPLPAALVGNTPRINVGRQVLQSESPSVAVLVSAKWTFSLVQGVSNGLLCKSSFSRCGSQIDNCWQASGKDF
jgi:hypothetical protein